MKDISITYFKKHFSEVLSKVEQGYSFYITRYKKRVAVLCPYKDWEKLKMIGD